MSGCATTYEAGAPPGEVDIIAHRGASAYAPENTMAAFSRAIEMNADWLELDCTLTKDCQVVVIHDDDLLRTAGVDAEIADLTYDEIRRHDVGSWFSPEFSGEHAPALAEVLDLAKDRIGVYIEIKDSDDDRALQDELLELGKDYDRFYPEYERLVMRYVREHGSRNAVLAREVVRLVREHGMRQQVVIQSFSPIVCAVVMSEAPELRVEFLATSSEDKPELWGWFMEWFRLLNTPGLNVNKRDVTPELVQRLHADDRTIAVWTVNEEADMRRLKNWGVDALITDRPDAALEAIGRRGR